MFLQQVAKVQQGSRVRYALAAEVHIAEVSKSCDVIQRVFAGLVGQIEPVGHAVHAQHSLQRTGRSAVTRFGVVGLNQFLQCCPGHEFVHPAQKDCFAGGLAVGVKSACG